MIESAAFFFRRGALQGKTVLDDGTVDHNSEATTPHLRLGIVWYILRGISIHNNSHNLPLILGLNYAYLFPGVGTTSS